ncbi:multiple epidermal growth factor-like domains protein 6 [Trichonephila clavipes]|nr:multiple epidermal growth factor-like domains protein 6 [Trichonephila clavipes]
MPRNIDECSTNNPCAHVCHNTPGSFTCMCHLHFQLGNDGKSCFRIEMEVVNTCADKNGGCDQKCRHGPGGPICSCYSGYELDADGKNCNDIDECRRGISQCKQDCNNSPGGYSCACQLGYTLNRDGITCNGKSCDLTPLDYFLWGYVKSLVDADKQQTLDHLEDNIRRVIADIRPQMLEKVLENWTFRLDYIRASRGSPMPEITFKM